MTRSNTFRMKEGAHLEITVFNLRLLSVKDKSGQMHLNAADHVSQNSSAHVVLSAQMHLTAVRLTETGFKRRSSKCSSFQP